jgi:hypothetical protein
MTKKNLFEDVMQNPARIYRSPGDVLRDRRFDDAERLEILQAWREASGHDDIAIMIAELENRLHISRGHAAE